MLTTMMLMISISILLKSSFNPLKLSLFLSLLSIIMSLNCFLKTNSMLIPCILVISFSSGMMILFSYCSIFSNFQTKSMNNKKKLMMVMVMPWIFFFLPTSTNQSLNLQNSMSIFMNSKMLVFIMMMIIITMIAMNLIIKNPSKKMMMSY